MKARKILIATDISDQSKAMMQFAAKNYLEPTDDITVFAAVTSYPLAVVPEIPPVDMESTLLNGAKARLSELIREIFPQFTTTQKVVLSLSPAQDVVDEAQSIKADLIMMGSHGAGAAVNLFIGSTVQRAIHLSSIPIFVIPYRACRP